MTTLNDDVKLEVHDIYLAAFLMVAGCVLDKKYRVGPRVYFVFTNPAGSINELRDSYYSGSALVKAHDFAQRVVAVKQLCFGAG